MKPTLINAPLAACVAAAVAMTWAPPSDAKVTKIVVDRIAPLTGQPIPYETLTGRAFGELDPNDLSECSSATPAINSAE